MKGRKSQSGNHSQATGADLAARGVDSRDTINKFSGVSWQAIDSVSGLVRIGVQSAVEHPKQRP